MSLTKAEREIMLQATRSRHIRPLEKGVHNGCLNCGAVQMRLSSKDRPHAGFGSTALYHGKKYLDSWIDYETMPSIGVIVRRFLPKAPDASAYILRVSGPFHTEWYTFDFSTRRFVLTKSGMGFA